MFIGREVGGEYMMKSKRNKRHTLSDKLLLVGGPLAIIGVGLGVVAGVGVFGHRLSLGKSCRRRGFGGTPELTYEARCEIVPEELRARSDCWTTAWENEGLSLLLVGE